MPPLQDVSFFLLWRHFEISLVPLQEFLVRDALLAPLARTRLAVNELNAALQAASTLQTAARRVRLKSATLYRFPPGGEIFVRVAR